MTLTWEEAAAAAAHTILEWNVPKRTSAGETEGVIATYLDAMRDTKVYAQLGFTIIGAEALHRYTRVTAGFNHADTMKSVLAVVVMKQYDYGPQNILWGGAEGIALRMHDKLARIQHLMERGTEGANEPLSDSWLDLVGYAIVAVMLANGTFESPMMADLQEQVAVEPPSAYAQQGVHAPLGGHMNAVPPTEGDVWAELAADADIAAALAEFTDPIEPLHGAGPDTVRHYAIRTGGHVVVRPHFANASTTIEVSDGVGGSIFIEARRDGACVISTQGTTIAVDGDHMAVILAMLLGAAETALRWRNTNFTAEVPR